MVGSSPLTSVLISTALAGVSSPVLPTSAASRVADSTSIAVEAVMTVTSHSASTTTAGETITSFTTEFTTYTLPDGEKTTIPVSTETVVTVLPTGSIEPDP